MILQAALSLVLLVGAGLMAKSLMRLENQDFGVITDEPHCCPLPLRQNADGSRSKLQGV